MPKIALSAIVFGCGLCYLASMTTQVTAMKKNDKRLEIIWLCLSCPRVMPLQSCILQKYRNEIALGKTDIVEQLSDDEVSKLIEAHQKCMRGKATA